MMNRMPKLIMMCLIVFLNTIVVYSEIIGKINDSNVNVRDYPVLEDNVLGQVNKNDTVVIIGRSAFEQKIGNMNTYWVKITWEKQKEYPINTKEYYWTYKKNEKTGWVYGAFVDVKEILPKLLPVITTDRVIFNEGSSVGYHYAYEGESEQDGKEIRTRESTDAYVVEEWGRVYFNQRIYQQILDENGNWKTLHDWVTNVKGYSFEGKETGTWSVNFNEEQRIFFLINTQRVVLIDFAQIQGNTDNNKVYTYNLDGEKLYEFGNPRDVYNSAISEDEQYVLLSGLEGKRVSNSTELYHEIKIYSLSGVLVKEQLSQEGGTIRIEVNDTYVEYDTPDPGHLF